MMEFNINCEEDNMSNQSEEASMIRKRRIIINQDKTAIEDYLKSIEEYRAIVEVFASKNQHLIIQLTEKLSLLDEILGIAVQLLKELTKLWFIRSLSINYRKRLNRSRELTRNLLASLVRLSEWNVKTKTMCQNHTLGYSCLVCYDNEGVAKTRMSLRLNQRMRTNIIDMK